MSNAKILKALGQVLDAAEVLGAVDAEKLVAAFKPTLSEQELALVRRFHQICQELSRGTLNTQHKAQQPEAAAAEPLHEISIILNDRTFISTKAELNEVLGQAAKFDPKVPQIFNKKNSLERNLSSVMSHFRRLPEGDQKIICNTLRRMFTDKRHSTLEGWSKVISGQSKE